MLDPRTAAASAYKLAASTLRMQAFAFDMVAAAIEANPQYRPDANIDRTKTQGDASVVDIDEMRTREHH